MCTWRSLERPWGSLGGPGASLESVLEVLRGPWGGLGRSQEVLGGGLGGTQNRRGFLGGSREGPGVVLGWFWCSGMVLGSVLGGPNVNISLIILMF